jgi:predicted site-specific integrase-resolvase
MYNLRDVMRMLKIPERTIRRHIKEGLLVGSKIGGVWKFSQDEIENYVGRDKVQKHIKDEGLKDITDYYRVNIEDKSEVVYMSIKQFNDITRVKKFLKVTKLFKSKFSMNCSNSGNCSCFTFKGQPEDVTILMKWSDEFDKHL